MNEAVTIPKPLLKELYEHFDKIEEILATLEELSDKQGQRRIARSRKEYERKQCVTVTEPAKLKEILLKG